jgi:hypothetical protein
MATSSRERVDRIVIQIDDQAIESLVDSFWERPEFLDQRPPRAAMVAFVRWNVDLVLRWYTDDQPPSEEELERIRGLAGALAAGGVPMDTVPANYRIGARYVWRQALQLVAEEDRVELLDAAELILEYVDRITTVFTTAYEESARATPEMAQERDARALLERLCAGEDPLTRDQQLASAIGFDVTTPRYAFVVAVPSRSLLDHVAVARHLRAQGMLAVARGLNVVGLANRPLSERPAAAGTDAVIAEDEVLVPHARRTALDRLRVVVDVALQQGRRGVVRVEDYLVELLLHDSPELAARVHARVYGGLNDELAQTLDALVQHRFDRGEAAAALPVHRNTLRNRLQRVEQSTGIDVDSVEGHTLVALAWTYRQSRLPLPDPA